MAQAQYLAVHADVEQRSAGLNPELRGGPLLLAVEPVDPPRSLGGDQRSEVAVLVDGDGGAAEYPLIHPFPGGGAGRAVPRLTGVDRPGVPD